ncbi:hypothetical protein [Terribacillus saccharophilus]|uniref:hypothetical protein n=1 Tax=Terribacillus saccharophilus TaxID=361277 RepID=UPI003982D1D0
MRGIILSVLAFTVLVLVSCSPSDKEDTGSTPEAKKYPEVAAFQDSFTRDFLTSVEPTRNGHFPFLSQTMAYAMDFPEDMIIGERSYNIGPDNRSEFVTMSPHEPKDIYVEHTVEYYSFLADEEHSRESISARMGVELNFEEIPIDYASQQMKVAEYQFDKSMEFATLIWKEGKGRQIHVFSSIRCVKGDQLKQLNECSEEKIESAKEEIIDWLKTIQLFDSETEPKLIED